MANDGRTTNRHFNRAGRQARSSHERNHTMKVKVNIRDLLADHADHNDLLLFHGGVEVDDLLDTNGIDEEQELDVHDLLAEHQAIALIWDADQLLSHYPHLRRDQAWEVLQQCQRNYKGEEGLSWDDIAMVVEEMYPEDAQIRTERVGRFELALMSYDTDEFGTTATLTDLLADARHWCDAKELDFSEINGTAYQHYLAERHTKE